MVNDSGKGQAWEHGLKRLAGTKPFSKRAKGPAGVVPWLSIH